MNDGTTAKPNPGQDRPWCRQSTDTKAISEAVVLVMGTVRNVEKGSTNKFQGYKYASDADLLFALQPALVANGLHWRCIFVERAHVDIGGKMKLCTRIDCVYRLHHTSGQWMDYAVTGEGSDNADKGVYKALTGAYKYLQRQAFAIPTGDDPEKDNRKKKETAAAKKARQQKHHPSWTKEHKFFFVEISKHGWEYERLCDVLEQRGTTRPSMWSSEERTGLLGDMASGAFESRS